MDNYSERNILKLIQSVRRRRFALKVILSCYSIIHWSQKEVGRDATIHPNDATCQFVFNHGRQNWPLTPFDQTSSVRSVSCEGKKEKEQGRREEKDRDGISSGKRKTAESSFSSLCQGKDSYVFSLDLKVFAKWSACFRYLDFEVRMVFVFYCFGGFFRLKIWKKSIGTLWLLYWF